MTLFILALVIAACELFALHVLTPLENNVLDWMVRTQARGKVPSPDIVVVNIDDPSLARMQDVAGAWPWPRAVHAELVAGLQRQQPRAIVFDISFVERDIYRPESDQLFNESLAGSTNVYFPIVRLDAGNADASLPAAAIASQIGLTRTDRAKPDARLRVMPPLAVDPKYWRTGSINMLSDMDGVTRHYELFADHDGWLLPSLPARVAESLGYTVPRQPSMLLSWRGDKTGFHTISYADLYEDFGREHPKRPANELAGKIVIIGADASGLNDLRHTPLDARYPGVQILAMALDNLQHGSMMQSPPAWQVPLVLLLSLAALNMLFQRGTQVLALGAGLTAYTAAVLLGVYWAIGHLWLVPAISALLLLWAYYIACALQAYLAERRSRRQAVQMFSRFVNPHVVQQLVQYGDIARGGEARDISVLFSDIRGFTTLSENRSPQEVVALLNRYFTLQVEVVFRHGGSLDKFIGDCIMAFWGAPLDDPDHARHAVEAALEMAEVLQRFKKEMDATELDFDVGIGIHSGPAVVGLIGSDQRREYTAIGDTVNLASRIEGLTKGVTRILVSSDTVERCGDAFEFTPFGAFDVKGREQQVSLFGPEVKKGGGKA
ncbi:CHASE2 domain-containing protein [Duganella ginsengisoli]|uniref:CHASE2 domain-containing protein n=1 Tax=Pseudoduganella ginsengisoli TaxID=1462440 RepID=A0A6L6Q4T8_9BURK|nr:CHASE2 domain-containing protein [Pseudoduganella ginsengisoli]